MLLSFLLATSITATQALSGGCVFTNKAINTACNANVGQVATASLTCAVFEVDLSSISDLRLEIEYDWGSATHVNMAVDTSATGTVPWHTETTGVMGAGVIDMAVLPIRWAVTADTTLSVSFSDLIAKKTRFRFWTTGGTSADKLVCLRGVSR